MWNVSEVLNESKCIAVVGLSERHERVSYQVSEYLQQVGYRILPVNPSLEGPVLGEQPYANLRDVPVPVDLVNIFRRPKEAGVAVDEAIEIGAKCVWLQLGIVNEQAGARATAAGLHVVMDRCIMVEHRNLTAGVDWGGETKR